MGNSNNATSIDPTTNLTLIQQYQTHRVFKDDQGKKYDKYLLNIDRFSMETYIYQFRKKNRYNSVVDTFYSTFRTNFFGCEDTSYNYEIVTQHIQPRLCDMEDLKFWDATNMLKKSLKGFNTIYKYHGAFEVSSQMIGYNSNKQVKVWLSKNLWKNTLDNTYLKLIRQTFNKKQALMINSIIKTINMSAIQSFQWKRLIQQLQSNEEILNFIDCQAYVQGYCHQIQTSKQAMNALANNQQTIIQTKQLGPKKYIVQPKITKCQIEYPLNSLTERKKIFLSRQQTQLRTQNKNIVQLRSTEPKAVSYDSFYSNARSNSFQTTNQNIALCDKTSNIFRKSGSSKASYIPNETIVNKIFVENSPRSSTSPPACNLARVKFSYSNSNVIQYRKHSRHSQSNQKNSPTFNNNQITYNDHIKEIQVEDQGIVISDQETTSRTSEKQKTQSNNKQKKGIFPKNKLIEKHLEQINQNNILSKRNSNTVKEKQPQSQFYNYWRREINIFNKKKDMESKRQELSDQDSKQLCEEEALLRNPYVNS